MDTTRKFEGRADDYTAGRPTYARELIGCLFNDYGLSEASVIADIGSGTGKFAKHLLERGSKVYCVEPNEDMRHAAEKELCQFKKFHSVQGNAENTTLESGSVDHITAAQAFHWFDVDKFKKECSRIIRNNGKIFLLWNVRDNSDSLNQELYRVYSRYCPNFKGFSGGIVKDDPRIKAFFCKQYDYISFDNPLCLDRERFIARSLSGSYSLKADDEEYDAYIENLLRLFDKYSEQGAVMVANQSVAYIGSIR